MMMQPPTQPKMPISPSERNNQANNADQKGVDANNTWNSSKHIFQFMRSLPDNNATKYISELRFA